MERFLEKFGCLSTIILVVGIIFLFKRVDYLCYITHDPVEYCRRFPSGKYQDRALEKVIYNYKNNLGKDSDYSFFYRRFRNQRGLAAFIQPLRSSSQKDTLEAISKRMFESMKRLAYAGAYVDDYEWKHFEDNVEDKYKSEITTIREDLERRWDEEESAWGIVCNANELINRYDKQWVLKHFLSLYPDGKHALEANELLVSVLEEEVEYLEGLVPDY